MGAKGEEAEGAAAVATAAPSPPPTEGAAYGAVAVLLSRFVVGHPLKVLLALLVQIAAAGFWAHKLKEEMGMAAVVSKTTNSVLRDFPETAEKIRDVMVFWCTEPGCDLTQMEDFSIERRAVQGLLDTSKARNRFCPDLAWQSIDTSPSGSFVSALKFPFMSSDKTTSYVEYHSTRRECMRDLRRRLQRGFHKATGPLKMSLGGPESVAGASMDAELLSMLRHAYVAVPLSCLLLWLFVGNLFRVLTPVICMVAAYLSGQGVVGAVKLFVSPGLNVQYDDSFVLFIDLALCVDYALFFWTRFIGERPRIGYEEALTQTLQTSGAVITVSNFFVVVAWTCTLCFPNLNLWGFQALYLEALSGCAFAGLWSLCFTAAAAAYFPWAFDSGPSPLSRAHTTFWTYCPDPTSFWKPWAKRITSRPLMLILPCLAYAAMVPCVVALTRYHPSFDIQKQGVRTDTLEHKALTQFQRNFRLGMLSPVTLVVEAKEVPRDPGSYGYTNLALRGSQDYTPAVDDSSSADDAAPSSGSGAQLRGLAEQLGPEGRALLGRLAAGGVEAQAGDVASMMQLVVFTRRPRRGEGSNQTGRLRERLNMRSRRPGRGRDAKKEEGVSGNETSGKLRVRVGEAVSRAAESVARGAGKAIRKLALNPDFGQVVCTIAEAIMNKTRGRQYEIQMADMLSIWWLPPQAGKTGCSAGTAKMVMHEKVGGLEKGLMDLFPPVLRKSISKDGKKVQLKLFTRFSPSSPEAVDLDNLLRKQLENDIAGDPAKGPKLYEIGGRQYSLRVRHTSAIARQVEANREMANAAPKIFGIFVALIAVLITFTFRSAFLSIKLALTVLCPIVATYGVTVAVYQLNVLGFLHAELLQATGGLDFRMIYVTPGVLFGLAMDYDLFLFARAYEHRLEGFDNTSAVRRALEETGPVITAAGILMAISFFAIMLSNTILFRTLGFVFFFGVTFDVLVIRTCIAPVFLCLAETLNYWPRQMPKSTKSWD